MTAWWPADTNAYDYVGENHGQTPQGIEYAEGLAGGAFSFNGSSQRVTVPDNPQFRLLSLSIEGWVKVFADGGFIFFRGDNLAGYDPYSLSIAEAGRVAFQIGADNGDYVELRAPVPYSNWVHVAGTFDSINGNMRLYVNGGLLAETDTALRPLLALDAASEPAIGIGNHGGTLHNFPFTGLIDNIALYSRALNSNEVWLLSHSAKCYMPPVVTVQPTNQTLDAGATLFLAVDYIAEGPTYTQWRFNGQPLPGQTNSALAITNVQVDGTGNYSFWISNRWGVAESSHAAVNILTSQSYGCANDLGGMEAWWPGDASGADALGFSPATMYGGVTFSTNAVVGRSFALAGGAHGRVANSPRFQATNALTVEAWVYPRSHRVQSILSKWNAWGGPDQRSWSFALQANGDAFLLLSHDAITDSAVVYGTNPVPLNTWTHLAGTYDGSSLKLYINGVLHRSIPYTSGIFPGLSDIGIGGVVGMYREGGAIAPFDGLIDEPAVYSKALTAAQIHDIFTAGAKGKCAPILAPVFVRQPTSHSVNVGDMIYFDVTVTGVEPLSYLWRKDGIAIPGGANPWLIITNAVLSDAGAYSVRVANIHGVVESSNAWLTVLTSQTNGCANALSGMEAWWPGEGGGADVLGASPATMYGGVAFSTNAVVGSSFALVGGAHGRVANSPRFQTTNALTVEAWVYPKSHRVQSILSKWNALGGPAQRSWSFALQPNGDAYLLLSHDAVTHSAVVYGTNPVPLNAWTHLAGTYDGSELRLYVNGVLHRSIPYTKGIYPGLSDIGIGGVVGMYKEGGAIAPFDGLIDEPAVYSQALTAAQVQAIFMSGANGKCVPTLAPVFVQQPSSHTVDVGAMVHFDAEVAGAIPLSYLWRKDGSAIPGGTNPWLIITNAALSDAGTYSVRVTNSYGVACSSNAVLTVIPLPGPLVRVMDTNAVCGAIFRVPIQLQSKGDVGALGFSLQFPTDRMWFQEVELTSASAGASLLVNTNLLANGQVGVAIALPAGSRFSSQVQTVAILRFAALPLTSASSNILSFGDSPITRQVADYLGNIMNAGFSNGVVRIYPGGFEGDVAPRFGGDGTVTVADWVLIGRMAARQLVPSSQSEFTRADCAPRATLGDGVISVTDWVQAGRYAAALDPLTATGGPTSRLVGGLGAAPRKLSGTDRLVKATSAGLSPGNDGSVNIELIAQGGENALGFSLKFDPAILEYRSAALASDASSAMLEVNTDDTALGRIGVVLALPAGHSFEPGAQHLLRLTFTANAATSLTTALSFVDEPVNRELADVQAESLGAVYQAASITIDPRPALDLEISNNRLVISWPAWASDCALETTEDVSLQHWGNSGLTPTVTADGCRVEMPVSTQSKFFRLRKP
jgi:hypothetical protein